MAKDKVMFKGFPVWARAVIAIVLSGVILAGFGTLMVDRNKRVNALESMSQRAFYDLTAEVNDIEIKLDKLSVSNGAKYQRQILGELVVGCELAENNISQLDQGKFNMQNTSRYINQVGDYAKSLQKKLDGGTTLSSEDKVSLDRLREVSANVGRSLARMRDKMGDDYDFTLNTDGVGKDFGEIDLSIEYPELIYDGPFSDAVLNATPKGIKDIRISDKVAMEFATKAVDIEGVNLVFDGEWSGKIKSLNFSDKDTSVKLAIDGTLLSYDTVSRIEDQNYSETQCVERAKAYLDRVGFSSMSPVWYSNYGGNIFVNFVYESDGVLYYADMVKVKVSSDTGKVVGFEGISYAYNHIDRPVNTPSIDKQVAGAKVQGIDIETTRLVCVPEGLGEVLCWEVFGSVGEKKYFVYIDATTGEEFNILSVIDSEQGDLLM